MLLVLFSTALALPPGPDDDAAHAYGAKIDRLEAVAATLKDAAFTFHKRERVGGQMMAEDVIDVRFRAPEDILLHFVGKEHQGRRVLYQKSVGEIIVDDGAFIPTLSLDPTGSVAMKGERHPVWDISPLRILQRFLDDGERLVGHPEWTPQVRELGAQVVRATASQCYETRQPRDQDARFYADRIEVCFGDSTGMFSRIKAWWGQGGDERLVEHYEYANVRVNPGLAASVFDPDNPEYDF